MRKFSIGSQWKTRGGWRAVVVDYDDTRPVFWHRKDKITMDHDVDGYGSVNGDSDYAVGASTDLPSLEIVAFEPVPWKEPVVHEGWFNVYDRRDTGFSLGLAVPQTKEHCDSDHSEFKDRIACIKIKFTEGDGL